MYNGWNKGNIPHQNFRQEGSNPYNVWNKEKYSTSELQTVRKVVVCIMCGIMKIFYIRTSDKKLVVGIMYGIKKIFHIRTSDKKLVVGIMCGIMKIFHIRTSDS